MMVLNGWAHSKVGAGIEKMNEALNINRNKIFAEGALQSERVLSIGRSPSGRPLIAHIRAYLNLPYVDISEEVQWRGCMAQHEEKRWIVGGGIVWAG